MAPTVGGASVVAGGALVAVGGASVVTGGASVVTGGGIAVVVASLLHAGVVTVHTHSIPAPLPVQLGMLSGRG